MHCIVSFPYVPFCHDWTTSANAAAPVKLVTEEAMVTSPRLGHQDLVPQQASANKTHFDAARTLVLFTAPPISPARHPDLELNDMSLMDYMPRRGFNVYLLDFPGFGHPTRPASMDQLADARQLAKTTAQAVQDYAAVVDWLLARQHLSKLNAMGRSGVTTIAGGFAAAQPEKVNRLVLYTSVWLPRDAPPTRQAAKLGAYRMVAAEMAKERCHPSSAAQFHELTTWSVL